MPAGNEKLILIAYSDEKFGSEKGRMTMPVNPSDFKINSENEFSGQRQTPFGLPNRSRKYKGSKPDTVNFDLLFDSTGVTSNTKPVKSLIADLYALCYTVNGNVHRPNFLQILWGDVNFKGQLIKLDIDYRLFKPDGTPIRAIAQIEVESYTDVVTLKRTLNLNSPDLTHIRIFKKGDSLPLMCKQIYGSEQYYIHVARINKLGNFRNLQPGDKIYFPPLKSS